MVWELEAGRPNHQVLRFHRMAAISSAKTMANPAPELTWRMSSTGSSVMTAKATVPVEARTPGQVADSRPDHGDIGLQRVGVDDRGHGVGRVVEAVDELEAERDQQGQGQQQIGPDAGNRDRVQILGHMEADVAEAGQQGPAERLRCLAA